MADIKLCRICVRTDVKMYHINQYELKFYYEEVMTLKTNIQDGLPLYVCYECATNLHKFHKFKEKCYCGQKVLQELLRKGPITYESIYQINFNKDILKSPLSIVTVNNRTKTFIIMDRTAPMNGEESADKYVESVDLDSYSEISNSDREDHADDSYDEEYHTSDDEKVIEEENLEPSTDPMVVYVESQSNILNNDAKIEDNDSMKLATPIVVAVESQNGILKIESKKQKNKTTKRKNKKNEYQTKLDSLNNKDNWKRTILKEEEAWNDFQAKKEDKKYLLAAFKCTDCLKGFSKKNMLDRHRQLRHNAEKGQLVCRFCKYRFRIKCHLEKHMRQHYNRFECLRCKLLCPLENTALLHEEYHSGVTRKCTYCDEVFRHSSSYYSHLRTHRSEHVCTLCGASFVSKLGLHQHKIIKHCINENESPDDDEEVNTYCQRCDIRFETRKAYEEHLFHSALHSDEESRKREEQKLEANHTDCESTDLHEKVSASKKVLSKKEKEKITKAISKRNTEEDVCGIIVAQARKRFKRNPKRRTRTKPTTCHQCGKHFETQAACMKHHITAHPRTSFHPPNERYICEICGSSLAPGSVTAHQNMHTREKLHTCDTCGKQFHSFIGLKRHLVTHTGEKPYGCPLCDKKFTQSNSMKLHYRTFHLKQPYPKRNRRTKKDEPKETAMESNSEESSSSYDSIPDAQNREQSGIEPVTGAVAEQADETINYLTLT